MKRPDVLYTKRTVTALDNLTAAQRRDIERAIAHLATSGAKNVEVIDARGFGPKGKLRLLRVSPSLRVVYRKGPRGHLEILGVFRRERLASFARTSS